MAVDTRDKRFSLLGFGQAHGAPVVFPNPDGAVGDVDRPMWIYLYHGSGISITSGHPTMRRWGGVPYVRPHTGPIGRSW